RTITDMFASVRTKPDFGNDRFVRTLYEQARMHQAGRLMHLGGESRTRKRRSPFSRRLFLPYLPHAVKKRTIGFTA
ncbi:MAG: hypothetical protein LKK25_04980, partial [Sphaerochaeta sp.]|nr:hypothetical protein [Sphaerochaeta sp.]